MISPDALAFAAADFSLIAGVAAGFFAGLLIATLSTRSAQRAARGKVVADADRRESRLQDAKRMAEQEAAALRAKLAKAEAALRETRRAAKA